MRAPISKGEDVMLRGLAVAGALIFSASATAFAASDKIEACKLVKSDAERLACYDAAAGKTLKSSGVEYEVTTPNDIYLDWKTEIGKKVSVKGKFQELAGQGSIIDIEGGGTVFVDTARAPRSDRALVLGCNYDCIVTIRGKVFAFDGVGAGVQALSITKDAE